jgi:hypothetical protein
MTVSVRFSQLSNQYPRPRKMSRQDLFKELGWEDLLNNPTYKNTCATRMSLCLLKAGVSLPGRMAIKKGPLKGKLIEPGQARLSQLLASGKLFGEPQVFRLQDREKHIRDKQGIISFMKIPGYMIDGAMSGHIDLVSHGRILFLWDYYSCAGECEWTAQEFWFWPLAL